jgi:hypothetical protein
MFKNELSKLTDWSTCTIRVAPSLFTRAFISTKLDVFWTNMLVKINIFTFYLTTEL